MFYQLKPRDHSTKIGTVHSVILFSIIFVEKHLAKKSREGRISFVLLFERSAYYGEEDMVLGM